MCSESKISSESVDITLHLLDSEAEIISQHQNNSLPKNPHFISLHIKKQDGSVVVLGMKFETWQAMCFKINRTVKASLAVPVDANGPRKSA